MKTLRASLDLAIELTKENREEAGGIILHKPDTDEFEFVFLDNANAGKPIAPSLFTAIPRQYIERVASRFKDGWRQFGSYHTHPAFTPYASEIDRTQLFTGFPTNFIYAPRFDAIFRYSLKSDGSLNIPTWMVREGSTLTEHEELLFRRTYLKR